MLIFFDGFQNRSENLPAQGFLTRKKGNRADSLTRPAQGFVTPIKRKTGGEVGTQGPPFSFGRRRHIGVLSPHKKGSLTTEMLISATLPIEPMAQWAFFIG